MGRKQGYGVEHREDELGEIHYEGNFDADQREGYGMLKALLLYQARYIEYSG